jgi:hypothetical protein
LCLCFFYSRRDVVYAANSVIDEIFQKYTGNIGKNGLSQEMDISQTINGVTVRLERAYADNNVVLLGYTVSGPADYFTHRDKLTTTDGQIFLDRARWVSSRVQPKYLITGLLPNVLQW